MLLGMVHPDYGRAELLGEDAGQLRPETRAKIAYLAEGHPLYRWMNVRRGRPLRPCVLSQVGRAAGGANSRSLRAFAAGEAAAAFQRPAAQVSLALAVAADPELLILDDPTIGLDTVVRRDFLESLIQIIQRRGRTILFSSHILGDVERVADRIGMMVDGALRVDCPTDHFKETLRKVVLEFDREPPKFPAMPGLVSDRQVGRTRELIFVGYNEEHRRAAESLEPRTIDVMELNLEDAFIEYTRGPRRGLPIFMGETSDVQSASI